MPERSDVIIISDIFGKRPPFLHRLAALALAITAGPLSGAASAPPPATAGAEAVARPSFSAFRPSRHGFRFVNSFTGSPVAFAGVEIGLPGPSSYGLCGGMSFAAADLFIAGHSVPERSTPPSRGSATFEYLVKRQTTSLGPGLREGRRFVQWMARPDDGAGGTRELTAGIVPGIVDTLEAGEPVVLGLVLNRRGRGSAMWENHQVLAYRASRDATGDTVLHVYDPNYPGADKAVIRCRPAITGDEIDPITGWRVPILGLSCAREVPGKPTTVVRGIFPMPYEFTPPAPLD